MSAFSRQSEIEILWSTEKFKCHSCGYTRVTFPELLVCKNNASLKLIVNDEGQLLVSTAGNTLRVDESCHRPFGINIQRKVERRQA